MEPAHTEPCISRELLNSILANAGLMALSVRLTNALPQFDEHCIFAARLRYLGIRI